jgi:hypothetical protein
VIYSKRIDPVTAQHVRLKIDASVVSQLDLFAPGR